MTTDYQRLRALAERAYRAGHSREELLRSLRQEGATQMQTVKLVREVEGVSLGEAKLAVDESKTWADRRVANEHVRDIAEQSLDLEDA